MVAITDLIYNKVEQYIDFKNIPENANYQKVFYLFIRTCPKIFIFNIY